MSLTAWLNQELNLHFTDANWSRIFAICPVDTLHCHPCDTIGSVLANYNCHDTLTLASYLDGLLHFGWNDSTLMVMMDSCGVDSLWWTHCVSCDSIQWASRRYPCGGSVTLTAWLNQELNLHFTDENWSRIFAICPVGDTCTSPDSCAIYYQTYQTVYLNFVLSQISSNSCPNYVATSPLYTYQEFMDHNLCCSDSGFAMYADFIASFVAAPPCPSGIPTADTCGVSPYTYCDSIYYNYLTAIATYNISPWAIAHSHTLYPGIYTSSWAFQNAGYCGCASRYIDSLAVYSSANPSQLLPVPLPIISTPLCNEFSECEQWYYLLNQRITSYNNSPYAIAHDDSLDYPFGSYTEFLSFRFCDCTPNYITYLDTLIALPSNGIHDSTKTIFTFDGCGNGPIHPHSECDDAYGKYVLGVNDYNQYLLTHSVPSGTPSIQNTYPSSSFTFSGFCYCVSNYTNYLQSVTTTLLPYGISLTPDQVTRLDIASFCDGTYDCHDSLPQFAILDTMIVMDSSKVNNCAQQLIEIELQNAWIEYNEYLDSLRTSVSADYTKHCLSPFENFIQNYDDKEYHFTLYYYDQAGNLVKTIPPEGVTMLPITSCTDTLERSIIHDRTTGEQTIFTAHNMPTIYEYNSLNQLVKQNLPDHDPMDIWDFGLPSGLPSNLHVTSTQFVTSNKAYLTGFIQNGSLNRGYVFTSNDAGNTWKQLYDLVASDFNKVQMVDANVGYAVGNDGVVVKTIDGGVTWDLISTYVFVSGTSDTILVNLRDLYLRDIGSGSYSGFVAGDFGKLYQITDNGSSVTFNELAVPSPASKIFTSLTYNGTDYYAAGYNDLDQGFVYQLSGTTLTEITDFTTVGLTKVFYLKDQIKYPAHAFAVGLDGNLLKTVDGGSNWTMIHTGIRKDIKDVFFVNDSVGLALIDSAANNNQLFKTWNGGRDWEQLSEKGDYFNAMHFVDSTQGIAVGKNGVIKRIIANSGNYQPYFGLINIVKPMGTLSTIEFTAVASSKVSMGSLGIKNYATIVSADGQFFTTRDIAANSVSWRALSPVLSVGNPVTRIAQQIVKVTETINMVPTDLYLYRIPFINNTDEAQCYVEKNAGLTVQGSFISAPVSTNIPELYQLQKSILSDDIYGIGKIVIPSPADLTMYKISVDTVPAIPLLVFDIYSSTSAFSTMTRPSSFDISEKDSVLVSSMDAGSILARSTSIINTSTPFDNKSWSITPLSIYDIEPMNTSGGMITSGADGCIMTSNITGGLPSFSNLIGYNSSKLNAVCADQSQGFAAGDSGKLYTITLSASDAVFVPVITNSTANLSDLAFVNSTTESYVSGDKGTLLKIPEFLLASATQKMVPAPLTTNFNGVVFKTDGSGVFSVGSGSAIYQYNANNGIKIKPVFVHSLKDVHFRDANEGFAIGEHGIIRHTTNAGISWNVIKPDYDVSGNLPVYNSVWTTGPNQCLVAGNGDYLTQLSPNGLLSNLRPYLNSSSTSWNDIKFGKDVIGYSVSSDGKAAPLTYNSASNSVSVGTPLVPPGGNQFNALHIFNDNNFIAVGPANTISTYVNGSWVNQNLTSSGSSGNVYNDVFFHDDRNGYVVGDGGLIYRASANCNLQNLGANSIMWYKKTDNDGFIISDPDSATVDIKVVAFPGRYRGWVAGSYPGTLMNKIAKGSTYPYGRLLHDESFLYSSTFWYDKVGRLVLSQNTKQFNCDPKRFSYTIYDHLGRISETGEKLENTGTIVFNEIFGDLVNSSFNPKVLNDSLYRDWLTNSTGLRREVTRTFYDTAAFYLRPFTCAMDTTTYEYYQENLRNRVASTTYADTYVADSIYFDFATHYSYDIHGNVKSLLQDNRKLSIVSSTVLPQRFKRIDYTYDLISGKVNTVDLQKNYPDQFSHRYEYDADNRITEVYTSTNGVHWDRDASYYYYAHGPLARVELGDNKVQGIDYAYTLQGWIKGANSNMGDAAHDIGKDGQAVTTNPNKSIAKDAYGYTLNYYAGDYSPIDASRAADSIRFEANTNGSDVMSKRADLYNGNITMMATTISAPIASNSNLLSPLPQANAYQYDQLNRVLASRSFDNFDLANNKWNSGSTYANRYFNQFSYDANGNIINQARYGETGGIIDQFHYLYDSLNSCNDTTMRTVRNRLERVVNTSSGSAENMDFEYDAIGNLVKEDSAQIDTIYWTVSGKIKEIVRATSSTMKGLRFDYDPSGNRIAKHVYASNNSLETSTYYVRDAQGNILSTYELSPGSYMVKEREIYGSSRLGITKDSIELVGVDPVCSMVNFNRPIGLKRYELTNHLGNVLATISDRKLPYSSNSTTIDFYQPDILSANDYYPFGMMMEGRSFSSEGYRFGFNGKETDDQISSSSAVNYDYGARSYDSRLGRWMSIDPMTKKYPEESPYVYSLDNPIYFIDPDGGEVESSDRTGTVTPNYLVGIAVHAAAAVYFNAVPNFTSEVTFNVPLLNTGRADLVYRDANGNIAIWEIKPVSYRAAEKNLLAKQQIDRYMNLAQIENPNSFVSKGTSRGTPAPFEGTLKLTATEGLYTYDVDLFIPKGEEQNGLIYYTLNNPRLTSEAQEVFETTKNAVKAAAVVAVVAAAIVAAPETGGASIGAASVIIGSFSSTPEDSKKTTVSPEVQ